MLFADWHSSSKTFIIYHNNQNSRIKQKIFFFLVGCPEGWESFRDWCYYFNQVEKTYDDAAAYCKKFGGVLLFIEDQEENNFIFGEFLCNFFSFLSLLGV